MTCTKMSFQLIYEEVGIFCINHTSFAIKDTENVVKSGYFERPL